MLYEIKIADEKQNKEKFERIQHENKKNGIISKAKKYESFPIFHSGNYYSNYTFVCYFLLRLSPFSSIGLSVKGTFNIGERLFNSFENISVISKHYQEWIPELFYLPEMIINVNDYDLGTMTIDDKKKNVNDIIVPPWANFDPLQVSLEFNKILENNKISKILSDWVDLVFGFKLLGKDCIEAINLFAEGCYPFEDLKEKNMQNEELCNKLDSSLNLGCCPTQLFSKPHIQRKKPLDLETNILFFKIISSLQPTYPQNFTNKFKIDCRSLGDFKAFNELPKYNTSKGEGGLSSIRFSTDIYEEDFFGKDSESDPKYFAVGKNKSLLGPKFSQILSHCTSSLYITNPNNNVIFEYTLKESAPINIVISSIDGKYIIVGFTNGNIIKFRKRRKHDEVLNFPYKEITKLKTRKSISRSLINITNDYQANEIKSKVFTYKDLSMNSYGYWESIQKNSNEKSINLYSLVEEDRTGIPISSIYKMDLCESYSFLLAIDQLNNIYHYDFNLMKLLFRYQFNKISKTQYIIKYAKILHKSGDYFIGTKYSVHIFSINALPIANINMYDQELSNQYPITSCEGLTPQETYLLTGHSNGNLIIWELSNHSATSNCNKQSLFEDFHQRYRNSFKEKDYSSLSHLRKLIILKKFNTMQQKIIYIKVTDDLKRVYYIDQGKNIFNLGPDNHFQDSELKLKKNNSFQPQGKTRCKTCKKTLAMDLIYQEDNICYDCSLCLNEKYKTFEK